MRVAVYETLIRWHMDANFRQLVSRCRDLTRAPKDRFST